MDEDEKTSDLTIAYPPPARVAEATADPRIARVLLAVQRAKGSLAASHTFPRSGDITEPVVRLGLEVQALREELAERMPLTDEELKRLSSAVGGVDGSVATLESTLSDLRRDVSIATERQSASAQHLQAQVSALVALHREWRSSLRAWGITFWLVFVISGAIAVRSCMVATDTYDTLAQILENQAKAQAGQGTRR
jgi:hypothetical protein